MSSSSGKCVPRELIDDALDGRSLAAGEKENSPPPPGASDVLLRCSESPPFPLPPMVMPVRLVVLVLLIFRCPGPCGDAVVCVNV